MLITLILALVFTVLAGLALRSNHLTMNQLKETVIDDDHSGDTESLKTDLTKLRRFVDGHVVPNFSEDANTGNLKLFFGTGVFYLQESYRKAAQAAVDKVEQAAANPIDQNIYAEVRNNCDSQFAQWSSDYVNCFTSGIDQYLPADYSPPEVVLPDAGLYQMSYISPYLAWDPASLCLILAFCAYVVFFTTLVTSVAIRIFSKKA